MCFELEELNLKVLMMGSGMRVGTVVGMGGSCGDGGAVKVVCIREVCNCVELLAPCNRFGTGTLGLPSTISETTCSLCQHDFLG